MSFLDDLAAQRQKFVDGLEANRGDINLNIFDDFYPDQAHFIFEVLQNAESVGATVASFTLTNDRCVFEHNGRRHFDEEDVRKITGYHNTNKERRPDEIGRFGIGFKSVFAYTETPIIYSRDFSFQIIKRVLPKAVPITDNLGGRTRFVFPFDSPRRPADVAYKDIKDGLERLPDTTLLFLTHLQSIHWQIGAESSGAIFRISHATNENHIEVRKEINGETNERRHFLRFTTPAEGVNPQNIAIAFALSLLPKTSEFDPARPMVEQMRIVSTTGQVAVYFPAVKETSGLRFHLHAPFVPELSRASVKETDANKPLFAQLARLSAASLHVIRDLGLLTGEFLEVLPNKDDDIKATYLPIREAIIREMITQPLTPTRSRSHLPATQVLQAKTSLKNLLSVEDLRYLVQWKDALQWVIDAPERGRQNQFLAGLAITSWDVSQFVGVLTHRRPDIGRNGDAQRERMRGDLELMKRIPLSLRPGSASDDDIDRQLRELYEPDPTFTSWLAGKSLEWHQRMYALLHRERCVPRHTSIVRLIGGRYSVGTGCHFPTEGVECDGAFVWVDPGTYSSGTDADEQAEAKKLLEELGVTEVGEVELVQRILQQRYSSGAFRPDLGDLDRFVRLVENTPTTAGEFKNYNIFKLARGELWGLPSAVFLDSPFVNTGLGSYYDDSFWNEKESGHRRWALSDRYAQGTVSLGRLIHFAQAVGAQTKLEPQRVSCKQNPEWERLERESGKRRTQSGIDEDYMIEHLDDLLQWHNIELSKLIWRTMCELDPKYLTARYQKNERNGPQCADSQLVHCLRDTAWVPQNNEAGADDEFGCMWLPCRPAEASKERLLEGFPFDKGYAWLKKVGFGEDEERRSQATREQVSVAQAAGFQNLSDLRDGRWFAKLPPGERRRIIDAYKRKPADLPEHSPKNPDLRATRIAEEAEKAPDRITEQRMRTVSIGREAVKEQTAPYLKELYTNADGEMFCQICEKPLPFRLDDGSYYFEMVEFLREPHLQKRHYQNYLALCPNHAAMYQHANGSLNEMKALFLKMEGHELKIILARESATIYFTETHLLDLKTVIKKDAADQPMQVSA